MKKNYFCHPHHVLFVHTPYVTLTYTLYMYIYAYNYNHFIKIFITLLTDKKKYCIIETKEPIVRQYRQRGKIAEVGYGSKYD